MKTKAEILEDFGCPTPDFHENVTMFYPAIHSAMDEYAQQTAMEFAEWCEINATGCLDTAKDDLPGIKEGEWYIVTVDRYNKTEYEKYTTSELFAKFEAERSGK